MDRGVLLGSYAVSKCGHDMGEYYVITSVDTGLKDERFVYVANGKNRTIQKPKCKNIRHLLVAKACVPDFLQLKEAEPVSANLRLAELLKKYKAEEAKERKFDEKGH